MGKTMKTPMQLAPLRDSNLEPNYQCSVILSLGCWWASQFCNELARIFNCNKIHLKYSLNHSWKIL
ncbi:hypothetical protein X975_10679, partial [Stegodyphus mimosarum]